MKLFLNQIQTPSEEIVQQKTLSIIDLMTSGGVGGNIIMSFLGILSLISVYILIERLLMISRSNQEPVDLVKNINNLVNKKEISEAIKICHKEDSIIARMIEKGLKRIGHSFNEIHAAMENQGKLEVNKLEKNLTNLATISGAAPMIGFLGTVIGMILAFHEMASAGGNIEVEMLAQGIYTAMVTTVAGLVVGIIAYISYNYLVNKVEKVIFQMEARTTEFLDHLHQTE